jgi:hypothetical protein
VSLFSAEPQDLVAATRSRRPTVIVEEPTEPLTTANPRDAMDRGRAVNQFVPEPLTVVPAICTRRHARSITNTV